LEERVVVDILFAEDKVRKGKTKADKWGGQQ